MTEPADAGESGHAARPFIRWFANAYVQIGIGALLVTASDLLLRRGAMESPNSGGVAGFLGLAALASLWTWAGIVSYILSFISWIHVLRLLPLSVAFALINVVHVLVPIGAWLLLHEHVSAMRWMGISLVLAGILLIVAPAARAEERL